MVEDKKGKKQKNKGVNATPARPCKEAVYFSDTDTCSFSLGPIKSIARVKSDLQTVIDLMGPSTPQFLRSSSNDGDNELSATTDATKNNKSSSKANEDEPSQAYSQNTDKTEPPDITLQEDTDYSIVADKNSTTLDVQEFPQYICPPPLMPANMVYNSECMCPQIANFIHNKGATSIPYLGRPQKEGRKLGRHKNFLYNIFKNLTEKTQDFAPGSCEYYKMNIKESQSANSPPRRLIFDLVGDIPRNNYRLDDDDLCDPYFNQPLRSMKSKEFKNFNNEQLTKEIQQEELSPSHRESVKTLDKGSRKLNQRPPYAESNGPTRVDVYYFDRGDADYLKTTDSPPVVATENLAEKTETYTTRFWAEIFGTLHIGVSFGTSFILQLFRFFLYSLMRPLTVGIVQLGTDYFLKPCIATFFNAVVQPPLLFLFNVSKSLRDICHPIAEGMGYFLKEFAGVVKAFRIVDLKKDKKQILETDNSEEKNEKVQEEKTELVA